MLTKRQKEFFKKDYFLGISLQDGNLVEPEDSHYRRVFISGSSFKKVGFFGKKYANTVDIFFGESSVNWGFIKNLVLFSSNGRILSFHPLEKERLVTAYTTVIMLPGALTLELE